MAKQTYALTSGGLYDNGQATLFFLLLIITITIFLYFFFFFPPIISGPLSINA
jgi:hypothetical protein